MSAILPTDFSATIQAPAGAARTSESRTFTVSSGQTGALSTIDVSVADGDVAIAQLVAWQGDDPVGEECLWREIEL